MNCFANGIARTALLVGLLVLASPAHAQSTCKYSDGFRQSIRSVADQVVGEEADLVAGLSAAAAAEQALRGQLGGEIDRLAAEAAIAGLSLDVEARVEETSEAVGQVGEVARTDKQVGSGSGSSGTTTLSERSALPLLLGMAIEHGAIEQENNGTTLTLSTSPYGLMVLANEDNDAFYQDHWFWRMWGVSANFLVDSGAAGLNDLEEDDFASLTAKLTIGDRSTRSSTFQEKWRGVAQPFFQEKADRQRALLMRLVPRTDSGIRERSQEMMAPGQENTLRRLVEYLSGGAPTGAAQRVAGLAQRLETELCVEVSKPVHAGEIILQNADDPRMLALEAQTIHELDAKGQLAVKELVDEFQNDTPMGSITYTLNRVEDGSDYSEIKLIGDGLFDFWDIQFVANGFIALNHNPSDSLDQDTVRDYGADASLVTRFDNPITGDLPGQDTFSQIGVSLTARYRRLEDLDKDQATVQLKIDLPLVAAFNLPLSLSYSSRSDTNSKDEFKIGLGAKFDTDKLMALLKLGAL